MSDRGDIVFLGDIIESIKRIEDYIKGIDYSEFLNNLKTQDAVVRNLEIIGEAAKSISIELRSKYSDIPWKDLCGVRDKLIHDYFGINYDVIWDIIKKDLSVLKPQIEEIINKENKV